MGRVYLGESRSGRRLVLKVLTEEFADDGEYRERFAREVAAARMVSPLYTAAVVDADPAAKSPWLATTFIDGPSLEEWVNDHGPLSPALVLALAAGLAEALNSIHQVGLIHRDLKPSNILIDQNGPHIIDFGIALSRGDTRITSSLMVGTPAYMPPERINGLDAGPSGDIYSLGATLFFVAIGSPLVKDGTFSDQVAAVAMRRFDFSAVPDECRPIITHCLSQAPQDRPTATELIQTLVSMGVSRPMQGWWPMSSSSAQAPAPSRRRLLIGTGVLAGLAFAGTAAELYRRRRPATSAASPVPAGSPTNTAAASGPPGRMLWQVNSGSDGRPMGPDSSAVRVWIDRGERIITVAGSTVIAGGTTGSRLWTVSLPATSIRLWPWGDLVLAGDLRRLWLLDAQTGQQLVTLEPAATEEKNTGDNPDRMTVQIERIMPAGDQALIGLGTATVAIDRSGKVLWRLVRQYDSAGRRTPPPMPMVAEPGQVLAREVFSSRYLALRRLSNGKLIWRVPDVYVSSPLPPPPPPGAPPDEAWRRVEGQFMGSSLVLRDGPQIQVRSVSNGRLMWHLPSQTPVAATLPAADLLLVAADRLAAYRMKTGEQAWEAQLRGARIASVPGQDAIVAAHEGGLTSLDLRGQTLWHEPLPVGTAPDRLAADSRAAYVTLRPRGAPTGDPGAQSLPFDVVAFDLSKG
jgi:Protein kinase domain/PQQ-like domain